nr:receptor-like kinase TMK4 [Ipomoea trifida]
MAYAEALFFFFFFRLLLLMNLLSVSVCDDAAVMFKLLAALSPTPSGWSNATHPCLWDNVSCESRNVVTINIYSQTQSISGELPSELTHLASLQTLYAQQNSLSGRLPSFANMSRLERLYLHSNQFSSIPQDFLLGLTNLKIFTISDNHKLSPWQIPSYLAESTWLESFSASNANITGVIPNFLGSFPKLQRLELSYNNLTGSLPGSFWSSEIQSLWLNNQKQGLSGTIHVLSSMTQLTQIWLQANAFTGPIPDLSKCINLYDLQLRDNQLTGVVPVSITGLSLFNVTLQNNNLQGPMPDFGFNFEIDLGNGFFCDDAAVMFKLLAALSPTPSGWSNATHPCLWDNVSCESRNVVTINIYSQTQSISGELPSELTHLASLQTLYAQQNSLSGRLPSFANMSRLERLYLHSNQFSSIPQDFLLGLTNLKIFTISDNHKLSPWQIPSYLAESTWLESFSASNANITGVIPNFLGSFPKLQRLELSYNNLTGSLPGSF